MRAALILLLLLVWAPLSAQATESQIEPTCSSYINNFCVVRSGLLEQRMPRASRGSVDRMARFQQTYLRDRNWPLRLRRMIESFLGRLNQHPEILLEIRRAARIYHVPESAILGAIALEATLNRDWTDNAQDAFGTIARTFSGMNEAFPISDEQEAICRRGLPENPYWNDFEYWQCVNNSIVTEESRAALGMSFTYGLGQISPTRVMMVNRQVHDYSNLPLVEPTYRSLFNVLLNPRKCIHYIAANMNMARNIYKTTARFDISSNIGLIATLYNLGFEQRHARDLAATNRLAFFPPRMNFLGWLVANHEDLFRARMRNIPARR